MSKQKKPQPSSSRTFKLLHQSLTISDINFRRQFITASTELTILPLTNTGKLWKLPLNCKQCRILKITVNGVHNANFAYVDPTLSVCPPGTEKRNLEYYDSCHREAVQTCDSDYAASAGELTVKIPKATYDASGTFDGKPLKVTINFSLERPNGGVQFVIPPGSSPEAAQHMHVFSYSWENSSRLWFPCVDSYTELCHWSVSLTVPATMTAVSCGDLTDQFLSSDGKRKVFQYSLNVPTPAPCIAFAVGCFEIYPDPVMQEVTHFCLPGLRPILKNTVQFVHEVFGFYEELLSTRFPHSSYKLVFVDGAYEEAMSYATLGIFSTNLLHSARVIDQVPVTRRLIAHTIARQYFGCYVLPQLWNDWWLPTGIAGFITGLFCKKSFGSTDYQHWVAQEQSKVCEYECEHTLPPLCGTLAALQLTPPSAGVPGSSPGSPRTTIHPHLISEKELNMLQSKAHLVIRMIQLKVGHDLLLQVFNKLLTLATAAAQTTDFSPWYNLLLSTGGFMKLISTVSGKDISHFMEQWVCRNGVPRFHVQWSYVRKKNIVELKLKQDLPRGYSRFLGAMNIVVQEFDGCFPHTVQVEDLSTVHELPCHSKIRKAKKRKVPLIHGEEVDIDISSLDMEVPVLWVRVDPELQWMRQVNMEQSDVIWQCMLKYERDAVAQIEAIEALERFPSTSARDILRESILNSQLYYRVRIRAAQSLATLLADPSVPGGPLALICIFQKLFGSPGSSNIVKYNDFTDFAAYFLQKALPLSIAGMRNAHNQCPKEVFAFVMDLLKYSDNQLNKFSDGCYNSSLVDALAKTVTPKVAVAQTPGIDFSKTPIASLTTEAQLTLQEIVQHLNIEKVLPSYQYTVTASCLTALRVLQSNGHLPSDSTVFKEYATSDNFITVRRAAVRALVDIVQAEHSKADLVFLLDMVENDTPSIRLDILHQLAANPPFTRKQESTLNELVLVERLWAIICSRLSHDSRLRNAAVDLYSALYGRLTPTCVPGLSIVIDLKEKVARPNLSSPVMSPKPVSVPEEGRVLGVVKREYGGTNPLATNQPLVKVTKLQPSSEPSSKPPPHVSAPASASSKPVPSLSLRIPTARLKRPVPPSTGEGFDSMAVSPSPESAIQSDDLLSPYQPKAKKRKEERKHKKKHKHKERKRKRKHKHSSRESVDRDTTPMEL